MGKVNKGPRVGEQPPANTSIKFTLLVYQAFSKAATHCKTVTIW